MPNVFDEFLEELRRRQAAREAGGSAKSGEPGDDQSQRTQDEGPAEEQAVRSNGSGSDDSGHDDDDGRPPIFPRGYPRGNRGGGPFDGELPELHISRGWIVLGVVFVAIIVLLAAYLLLVSVATDAIWFNSVGFGNVFWTRVGSQIAFFAGGTVITFLVLWINLWLAGKFIPKGQLRRFSLDDFLERFNVERYMGGDSYGTGPFGRPAPRPVAKASESVAVPDVGRPVFWTLIVISALIALGVGGSVVSGWNTIQLFIHRAPFGQTDPTFGLDISFFMFDLPFYRLLQGLASSLVLTTLVVVGIRYLVAVISGASMPTRSRVHLGVLVALLMWSLAIGFQLDRYSLVSSSTSGIFQGVSFTDANAKMLTLNLLTAVTAFVGCFVLVFAYTRWRAPLAATLLIWFVAFGILDVGYPAVVQRFSVEPNQKAQEAQYISNNISMTRLAFNLNNWASTTYTPTATVTSTAVSTEKSTIQNVRLWDYRPLGDTLSGIQTLRQYYKFFDVDTDRYTLTDPALCNPLPAPCVRQVMIAGRELNEDQLAQLTKGDQSWVNQHITYTHGVGVAMVPVNEVAKNGQPVLLISNLPPASSAGVPTITEPRIYFGTQTSNYVIVDAASQEFDYPAAGASGDKYNSWTGTGGIKLDTPLAKLLYATKFGDLNMLISGQVTGSSQLLYNRSIQERVNEIAPFLRYDKDPYLVVNANGGLSYVLDGYTTSDAFPDSNPYDPGTNDPKKNGLAGSPFNYVRNSVKVVMNAYDGTMSFYIADSSDPIIKAWSGVYPGLFKPISEMPLDIRGDATTVGHLRYPEDLFNAQTSQFGKYHITDPGTFYEGNDFWSLPPTDDAQVTNGPLQLGMEAYYVQMRVPGRSDPEFMLLQPVVPQGKQNMIAWVAAHNDPTSYGQVSVFDFPRDSNVYGPQQIQALLNQNPIISQNLTLWGQSGSKVVLGNLLVIPVQDSLLYVEPVYIQAQANGLPTFQKVIVGTPSQVVWDDTLAGALNQIYSGAGVIAGGPTTPGSTASPPPSSAPTISTAPTPTPQASPLPSVSLSGSAQDLIAQANAHYEAAQTALHNGDLATYQKEMNIVGQLLTQLQATLGTPAPSPSK